MAFQNIDFGDGVNNTPNNGVNTNDAQTDITGAEGKPDGDDVTGTDGNSNQEGNNAPDKGNDNDNGSTNDNGGTDNNNGDDANNSSTGGLEAGTIINFDGTDYTVSESGDIVDKDGNVFKKADEVQAWLDENEATDDNSLEGIDIKDVIDSIGIEVKDENGKDLEFTNDKEGLKSYFDAVIDNKVNEANKATLNKFFMDNPIVKQFVDYITVNGGNPRGFGEIPDRRGITVDKDNEAQQEQIIRVAAHEFGNKAVSDAYIKYLKDSGALYDEAVNQLQALVEQDEQVRNEIEQRAIAAREAEEESVRAYWKNVTDIIASRKIAGYAIPESFVKEVNGQKVTLTPDDFYDYLYKAKEVDANGNKITGYQKDLDKITNEELLNKELLDAWLMFTGGSYKDLVNMAVKEQEVRKLIVKSKQQRSSRTIKVTKPNKGGVNDVILS